MTLPEPEPRDWQIANARQLALGDREVLHMLRAASREVNAELAALIERTKRGEALGSIVKQAQLEQTRSFLLAKQAEIFDRLGDLVSARRLRAASRSAGLSADTDRRLLDFVGRDDAGNTLKQAALAVSQRQVDTALARMGLSQLPLSQRIYNTRVWMDGRLGKLINATLAAGLNAREFAAKARDWFSPSTPGGVRFAALRLARTEINNAFHAIAVQRAVDTPWVPNMEWHLSKSHPRPDACNVVADRDTGNGPGVYKSEAVPVRPHPQCMCYVTPQPIGEDEFVENFLAGDYDDFLDEELAAEDARLARETGAQPTEQGTAIQFGSKVQQALGSGVKSERTLTGGVAAKTDLLETNDGTKLVRKTMGGEAVRGIDQLNDPKRQADAEELASLLLRSMGAEAPEVFREAENVVAMEFLDGAVPAVQATLQFASQDRLTSDLGRAITLFDAVAGNVDRNAGNWMVKLGRTKEETHVYAIDHGFAWAFEPGKELDPSPYYRRFAEVSYRSSPFWRAMHNDDAAGTWRDNDFSPADIANTRRRIESLRTKFAQLGRLDWYEVSLRRLSEIAKHAKGTEVHIR